MAEQFIQTCHWLNQFNKSDFELCISPDKPELYDNTWYITVMSVVRQFLANVLIKKWILVPEWSPDGRLHWHGICRIVRNKHSRTEFFNSTLPTFRHLCPHIRLTINPIMSFIGYHRYITKDYMNLIQFNLDESQIRWTELDDHIMLTHFFKDPEQDQIQLEFYDRLDRLDQICREVWRTEYELDDAARRHAPDDVLLSLEKDHLEALRVQKDYHEYIKKHKY